MHFELAIAGHRVHGENRRRRAGVMAPLRAAEVSWEIAVTQSEECLCILCVLKA